MALVNLSLLLGGGAIAIPIVLHLLLRPQPKRLVFPAVRFLQEKQESHRHRLQLRHLLLLLLRCLAVLLAAAALARPSVSSAAQGQWLLAMLAGLLFVVVAAVAGVAAARRMGRAWVGGGLAASTLLALLTAGLALRALGFGPPRMAGDREAPVAAALLFDTSVRMDYRFENRTRLEAARTAADAVLKQLPEGSELAVLDTRPGSPVFTQDRAAAAQSLGRLVASGATRTLTDSLSVARVWLEQSPLERKELYVFTDLSRGAWPAGALADNAGTTSSGVSHNLPDGVAVYLVDLGVERPRNSAINELRLSRETLPPSGELEIEADITSLGGAGTRTVELVVDQADASRPVVRDGQVEWPAQTTRGRVEVDLSEVTAATVFFHLSGLSPGTAQGMLQLLGEDGLAVDDSRYFTLLVREAAPVLVVVSEGATSKYFTEAVAPLEERQAGRTELTCVEVKPTALSSQAFETYAAVFLLDPPPLSTEDWGRLAKYVESGGGLGVFLGHQGQAGGTFHEPDAERLLGGRLQRRWRAPTGDVFLAPNQFDHPATREFREVSTSVPWDQFPVFRHWELDPIAATTRVVMRYSNGLPALLETTWGKGRTLVLTTPVSDPARPRGRDAWNELPTAPDAWPFVMLADQMARHLAGSQTRRLNFLTGQGGEWLGRVEEEPDSYQLFAPTGETRDVPVREGRAVVLSTESPGQYRLRGFRNGPLLRGFSVNLPPGATDLSRLTPAELDEQWGAGRYLLVRGEQDIQRRIGEARVAAGVEFYPFLLLALVLALGVEHLLANRFYGRTS